MSLLTASEWSARFGGRWARKQTEAPDEWWSAAIYWIDTLLRRSNDIYEFTDDPECVLRLGTGVAACPVTLMDGTEISAGARIGTLHLWNEHLPRYRPMAGPELSWAAEMQRSLRRSLKQLAAHIEVAPEWQNVQGFVGHAAFSSRVGALQLDRVAHRYGFEQVRRRPSGAQHLVELGNCIYAYGLAHAFNPGALDRQRLFRHYHELWISRSILLGLYRAPSGSARHRHTRDLISMRLKDKRSHASGGTARVEGPDQERHEPGR
jgi:hypothetical protein